MKIYDKDCSSCVVLLFNIIYLGVLRSRGELLRCIIEILCSIEMFLEIVKENKFGLRKVAKSVANILTLIQDPKVT